ncbi:MAG: DMT family transporter [Hyphomicrobiales bacterium]
MQFIASGVAGLLMGTIPLFVLVLAHFMLPGERLTPLRTAGFVLGFIGIIILMGPDKLLAIKLHGKELMGEAAVVFACLLYGLNAISAKLLRVSGIGMSAGVLSAGALMAVAAALATSPVPALSTIPVMPALALFGLGLFPTGLATVIWFKAVERTSPTFTAMSNYLVPVFSVAAGFVILGEPVGWNMLAALLFILGGIFLSRWTDISARIRPQPLR